jgi:cytochrome c556
MTKSKVLGGVAVLATVAIFASGVGIAQDAIGQRKAVMKAVGSNIKTGADMVKGTIPYDAGKAAEAMGVVASGWAVFSKHFPQGSETGGETTASPKIWQSFPDFDTKGKKLASDAAAAQKAAANGADAFKAAFGEVTKNCKGCHENYRVPKK